MCEAPVDLSRGPIRVSESRRFLVHEDGTPFFYLGDTAWNLARGPDPDAVEQYLADRAQKGFTVVQMVALGSTWTAEKPNYRGELPFADRDPDRPVEGYWENVDFILDSIERRGMIAGFLPMWGIHVLRETRDGPNERFLFDAEPAGRYGEFIGRRYGHRPGLIWVLGGDIHSTTHVELWRALAAGLDAGAGRSIVQTFHPYGPSKSSTGLHDEQWLDVNMIQSGHSRRDFPNYELIAEDYALEPAKPTFDGEPCYEDMPVEFKPANGYFDDYDCRKAAYRAVFAGACGHTYGGNGLWQFCDDPEGVWFSPRRSWREALDLPGSGQMRHLRALIESRPFLSRVPDQGLLACEPGEGARHVQATRCAEGNYAMVYVPQAGQTVAVHLDPLAGEAANACWFDPRTGKVTTIAEGLPARGTREFVSPGQGPDWVLVLDDASRGFGPPGQ